MSVNPLSFGAAFTATLLVWIAVLFAVVARAAWQRDLLAAQVFACVFGFAATLLVFGALQVILWDAIKHVVR